MKLGYDMLAVSATLDAMCAHLKKTNRPVASVIFRKYFVNEIFVFSQRGMFIDSMIFSVRVAYMHGDMMNSKWITIVFTI